MPKPETVCRKCGNTEKHMDHYAYWIERGIIPHPFVPRTDGINPATIDSPPWGAPGQGAKI